MHCYTNAMPLGAQLPVRLEPDVEQRLEKVAEKLGTTKSALIRLLAKTFVEQAVSDDGSVHLPPDWRELLPSRDTRSRISEPTSQDTFRPGHVNTGPTISGVPPEIAADALRHAPVAQRLARERGSKPSRKAASPSDNKDEPRHGTAPKSR